MSRRVLGFRPQSAACVDISVLTPERLQGLSADSIGAILLASGERVRDLFDISGEPSDHLVIRSGTSQLDYAGARMKTGTLTVEGNCGDFAGIGLDGGSLLISGNVGAYAASEMRSGLLEIGGNAGDFSGSAMPGATQGMRGGIMIVHGNAGDRTGDRMRRGLILVEGHAGDYCGTRMLAGTIVVRGQVGALPGLALKRGTLLFGQPPADLPATFQDSGEHELLFLTLLERDLRRRGVSTAGFLPLPRRVRRYCGDLCNGGAGEILVGIPSTADSSVPR